MNQGNERSLPPDVVGILKRLARRNLLRGYQLNNTTGERGSGMGVPPLKRKRITSRKEPVREVREVLENRRLPREDSSLVLRAEGS